MENIKNKKDLIIKLFLITIIILLLLHNCSLIKILKDKDNDKKTPTGNVDIFEIQCNNKDTCEVGSNKDNDSITTLKEDNPSKNLNKSDNKNNINLNLNVLDNDITWKSTNELKIFENPVYNMDQKIAPEHSNVYQFVIKNNSKYNAKYNIEFIENNPYGINIKYKLKKRNDYVVGNKDTYVSYSKLKQSNIKLNNNSSDTYYLEWKWISSDNDTDLSNIEDAYGLSISIKAENIND